MLAHAPTSLMAVFLFLSSAGFAVGFGAMSFWDAIRSSWQEPPAASGTSARPLPMPVPALVATLSPPPTLPPPAASFEPERARATEPDQTEVVVRRGDTLLTILDRVGIASEEAHAASSTLRAIADVRRLRSGMRLALEFDAPVPEGARLARLVWPVDAAREVHLVRGPNGAFTAHAIDRPTTIEQRHLLGVVTGSLYQSAVRAGMPIEELGQAITLLSWDLDLQREVQPGDRFEAVVEREVNAEGEPAGVGSLSFLAFSSAARTITAYRFTTADGVNGYYDRDGRSLRTWLLRTPVDGARLSSQFGLRRHPILGYTRLHRGADFAAPTGTPVLAAGDGVVVRVGRNGGYGNYVEIRHNATYNTAYAHLHRFAKGLARGQKVEQGEVIGFVGSTGRSTGPHLHYEVREGGTAVDPMSLKNEQAIVLAGPEREHFLAERDRIDGLRRSGTLMADRST